MIDILLAAYNGEKYISEQIESILAQSCKNWRLIVQDDCSTDSTAEIVETYVKKHPQKIVLMKREAPSGSAKNNFLDMLKYSDADYTMFCDQDDFWHKNKIEFTIKKMKQMEFENKNEPVLVHTQLQVVDKNLSVIKKSFFEYQGLDYKAVTLNRLLVQNNVTGCTMMINKQLRDMIKYEDCDSILMHDWWFALIASAFGKIGFVKNPTISYRQHGDNQLGAVNNRSIKGAVKILRERMKSKKRISVTYSQAQAFYDVYKDVFSKEQRVCIEKYLKIPKKNKALRMVTIIKNNYTKQNLLTTIGQLIFC